MKKLILLSILLIVGCEKYTQEVIIEINSHDNEIITGKLDLPKGDDPIKTTVIFIPGTGPFTYKKHIKIGNEVIDYFDIFTEQLNKIGVAFFRYNTRGTQISDLPPTYDKVDMQKYNKHIPSNHVQDIESIIVELKNIPRISQSNILLLGWSEGTIIASIVADRNKVPIDGLLLAGYVNETVLDIMKWQFSGASSMIFYNKHFDRDNDGEISEVEFENDPNKIVETILKNKTFDQIDNNLDRKITQEDMAQFLTERAENVFKAIEDENDDWIWENYFRVTSKWVSEHASLEPNRIRLLRLSLPIHIFHGTDDRNTPIEGVFDIQKRFNTSNKKNLTIHVFENHDHDLNWAEYPLEDKISNGWRTIFRTVYEMDNLGRNEYN